jgi:predicted dehydrogenase
MTTPAEGATRRDILRTTLAASAAGLMGPFVHARPAKKVLKAALVGCGGRGNGAISDILQAGQHLGTVEVKVVALADAYKDRVDNVQKMLAKMGQDVPAAQCFTGFDGYRKACASDADVVLMATAPAFRPLHFAAAVAAGKHVFIEKPVAVDAPGCRRMYEIGRQAEEKKLSVVAGTCLRHAAGYAATRKVVAEDKAIGAIRGGAIWYLTGQLWRRARAAGMSDAEYLVRNWVNFTCMSGDHIVEQYIHTLDNLMWHMNALPVAAVALGGRSRRQTGDQYDFFSVDYEFPGNVHIHGMCRQVNGCLNKANVGEIWGEKGFCSFGGGGFVADASGAKLPLPKFQWNGNMYVQEHAVLLDSILNGKAVNHTKDVTDSTLATVMSRVSAYTGQRVTWEQLMKSNDACSPAAADFEGGEVKAPPDDVIAIPGKA